jgi:hypothetical protein
MDLNATQRGDSHLTKSTVPAKRSQGEADIEDRNGGGRALRDWASDDVSASSVVGFPTEDRSRETVYAQRPSLHHLSPQYSLPTSSLHDSQPYPSPALARPPESLPNISQSNQFPDSSGALPAASFPSSLSRPSVALNQSGNAFSE